MGGSFRQDGSIEFHVYLTGLMQLKGTHARTCVACAAVVAGRAGAFTGKGEHAHGVLVSDHLIAPHHQHWFNLRLDFDVDGTRHREDEVYAGGHYPVGSQRAHDLATWTRDDESLLNEDVVVWYTLGVTHVARPEDFPVMPAAHASVRLLPKGFFRQNPALDVPDAPGAGTQ